MVVQEVPRIRRLFRDEYDKLAALGVFDNERLELLEGALVEMGHPARRTARASTSSICCLLQPS